MPRVKGTAKAAAEAKAAKAAEAAKTSVFTMDQVDEIVARAVARLSGAQHRASPANLNTGDRQNGQDEVVNISTDGDATAMREPLVVLTGPDAMRKIETEAFMNEMVEVIVDQSQKEGAPLFIHSGHNGKDQYLMVGEPTKIRRTNLYSLLQARERKGKSDFGKDANGKEYNKLTFQATPTHSVRVLRDPNPNGARWFDHQMKAA